MIRDCDDMHTREPRRHLFDLLLQRVLRETGNPSIAMTCGIGRSMVRRLIDDATLYMFDDFDIRLKARRLPRSVRLGGNRDHLWQALKSEVSQSCVAILGLAGKHAHWTVAAQVTPLSLRLLDSGKLHMLPRARCTVGRTLSRHQISRIHVLLFSRIS